MSKLADLRRILDAARADAAARGAPAATRPVKPSPRPAHAPAHRHAHRPAHGPGGEPAPPSAPAGDDIDLARAFADVTRLPPPTRARIERTRPAPIAHQRLAEDLAGLGGSVSDRRGWVPTVFHWHILPQSVDISTS